MSLRGKFYLLLAVFGLSVIANVAVSVWCIRIYVDVATSQFHVFLSDVRRIEQIRSSLDELVSELETRAERSKPLGDDRYGILCQQIVEQVSELPSTTCRQQNGKTDTKSRLLELAWQLSDKSEQYIIALVENMLGEQNAERLFTSIKNDCVTPMQKALGELTRQSNTSITRTATDVAAKQRWVTVILSINALVVFLSVTVVVHLVRHWMLKPVEALKRATERHAAGDLGYRIPHHSSDELGALSRQVNRMADSLATVQRRLVEQGRLAAVGELASSVAHNIRNPLASIRVSVQSAMKRLPENNNSRKYLTGVIEIVDSLNQWLHDLLTVHKSIELECRPVAARGLVDRVVEVIRSAAKRSGVRIEVEELSIGCMVHVDSSRVGQALLAVVNNAVEASPPNGVVRVTIHNRAEAPQQVEIRVTDSGTGIPSEIRDRLASPFSTTKPGGTGIGLYLAKRVAAAHGGEIEFQDNPSGGTIVTMSLPSSLTETAGEAANKP